ncbi:MAG: hypothetical protein JXQ73_18060 [Phycisphaerae bacterium]|nr:hypothetical protein [Phycisphaerae bacterium]
MTSKWTKLTGAAAAIIALVALLPIAFDRAAVPAYAVGQTIEATRAVRAVHVKLDPAGPGLGEMWAQFGENDDLIRMRMDFPNTPGDGPKIVICQDGKANVWFKRKNVVLVVREENPLGLFRQGDKDMFFNPKIVVDSLLQAPEGAGIEITEPTTEGEPIILTVSKTANDRARIVFAVDPKTKLLQRMEKYLPKGRHYELALTISYLEYDKAVDPNAFLLSPPDDAMCVDQTADDLGLPRGDLSEGEIAAKVAREFFEAVIAKDYAKAGKLCGGLSAESVPEKLKVCNAIRIVSIGQPSPHPDPRTKFQVVPCEIEIKADGASEVRTFSLNVRAVYGRPDRWAIGGGDVFK